MVYPLIYCWIQHNLTGRIQLPPPNNYQSALSKVTSGVPQGAGLLPLLFLIYINDLPANITHLLQLFADDSVMYTVINNPGDVSNLQSDLDCIAAWCDKRLIPPIIVRRKCAAVSYLYSINATPNTLVSSNKCLRVHSMPLLSWTTNIDTIFSAAFRFLGCL